MTSPAEPGATGRRGRGGAASQAPAAPEAPTPPVEGDTSAAAIAAAGTSEQAAQAAEKPVVVGAAETPVKPGGPGVGAERVAEEVETVASRPMAGSEASVSALTAAERAELEDLRRDRRERDQLLGLADRELVARGRVDEVRAAVFDAVAPAGSGAVVDARAIPETRIAQAAARIQRNGKPYAVGQPVPVDFEAYTELVGIGAIVKDRWSDLPVVGEA